MAYVKKEISPVNRQKRVKSARRYQNCTTDDFWRYIVFTDEGHTY